MKFETISFRKAYGVALLLTATTPIEVRAAESEGSILPAYESQQQISGVIRNYGNDYAGLLKKMGGRLPPDTSKYNI